MTTERITIWHCDADQCEATAPEDADGWTDATYTHGCPAHGELIAAHRAKVTDSTRGRGYRETTTWYLMCACGWTPRPSYAVHSYQGLKERHRAHVRAVPTGERS